MRVTSASVTSNHALLGSIDEPGLLLLVGITHTDTAETVRTMARKVYELRILRGEESCATTGAPLLVVSQFTLYGRTDKGRRPGWSVAAPGEIAAGLVDAFAADLRRLGARVETGAFGADMAVTSVNDGPFTVLLEI